MCNKLRRSAMILAMALTVFTASVISQVRPVLAAGSISLTADNADGAAVGDSVSVTYEAVSDGAAGDTTQVTIEYDPNRLELTAADKEYSGGGGNAVFAELSAVLTFTALSGGDAVINASAVLNGDEADVPTASITVSVAGEDTAAALSASEGDFSTMGVAAQTVPAPDGSLMVSTVFPNEYLPASFHKSTTLYQGTETECAKFDMGEMELLYTTDAAGQNAGFKIFDEGSGELSDFKMINGPEDRYIIILKADDTVIPPAGYIKATLQWNGQNFEAYMKVDESAETQNTDFFLVYAVSSEGNTGWYMYDQVEGTYQRFVMDDSFFEDTEESEGFSFLELPMPAYVIMGVLGLLCVIFLVIMIVSLVRLREYESYEYIDEDEEPSLQPARQKGQTGRIALSDAGEGKAMKGDIRDFEEDVMIDPGMKKKEKKAKEKAEKKEKKKAGGDKDITGSLDFEAMESAMKGEDVRRPKGVENRYLQEPNIPMQPVKQPQAGGPLKQAVLGPEAEVSEPIKPVTKTTSKAVQQAAVPAAPAPKPVKPAVPAAPARNTGAVNGAAKPQNKEMTKQSGNPVKDNKQPLKAAEVKATVQKTPQLTEQQKEDIKRQELLNAARKPENKTVEDPYVSQQYYSQDYQGQYYDPAGGYAGTQYGQGYSDQYSQNGYYQDGYQAYQYNDQYGYGQEQQYGYYEPVPSAPQYNTEQFGQAQYELQYGTGYDQYGNSGYASQQGAQYQGTGVNAQPARNYNNVDMDDDDDFEFEFINMN